MYKWVRQSHFHKNTPNEAFYAVLKYETVVYLSVINSFF